MIKQEELILNGRKLVKNYSDKNVYITRNGKKYQYAIDPIEFKSTRTYKETEEKIIVADKSWEHFNRMN